MRIESFITTDLSHHPRQRTAHSLRYLLAGLLVQLIWLAPAWANVYVVNSTADTLSTCPSLNCTLKGAIRAANNVPGPHQIVLQNGAVYPIAVPAAIGDAFTAFDHITKQIQITGNGAVIERLSSASPFRFFFVEPGGGNLTLDNLTLRGGAPPVAPPTYSSGGAVMNFGVLTVNNCILEQNQAWVGGAIASSSNKAGNPQVATLTIQQSSLRNNSAVANNSSGTAGGALYIVGDGAQSPNPNDHNDVTIKFSSIVNNTANNSLNAYGATGGGIEMRGANNLSIRDTTIAGNSAVNATQSLGGGLMFLTLPKQDSLGHPFSLEFINVTIVNNTAGTAGGGLYYFVCGSSSCPIPVNPQFGNTILANNQAPSYPDYKSPAWIQSLGNNIVGKVDTLSVPNYGPNHGITPLLSDRFVTTLPSLSALTGNGAAGSEHHRPQSGCLAINNGSSTLAGSVDQLGFNRVGAADVGAIEYRDCTAPPTSMAGWWPFDLGFGLKDVTGLPDNGWSPNGNAPVAQGMVDGSLKFNGSDPAIEVPNSAEMDIKGSCNLSNAENLSIDAWVKTGSAGLEAIVDKRSFNTSGLPTGYHLFIYQGRLGFQMANGTTYANYLLPVPVGVGLSDNRWHFVAVTVRRCALGTLYIDGQPVQTFTPLPGSISNTAKLLIGGSSNSSSLFKGNIDELELFKTMLSPQQVLALYNAGWAGKCKCALFPYPTC